MVIYGVALLSACMLVGTILGQLLGLAVGINANIGGVGIAMLILVLLSQKLLDKEMLSKAAESGVQFWSAMYIPIVVAMAARQNVVAAFDAGALAFVAGLGAVFTGFLLIRPIAALAKNGDETETAVEEGSK
ncbi:malonate transporter subunit MadL [Roseospira marina]|uniref:Malonate transporter subunit MadL n=1 Tax=Roseospira marina TaxID=140057 RepID=A0A5M6IEY7_9PROT|nr:malonate transporter subunit MadL [Roseospira marina]KAA5606128.1 malonate transporter subunit MadL [Roseospira marina]MBB4314266.1 malonate transporter MadL subunit [Roseospira marina]MBB5087426.1 malonate transporter MadL subunit [Roseospira marina]